MMQKVRQLPEQQERVETGAVQFGNDWPGLFIRGDDAFYYAHKIRVLCDQMRTSKDLSAIMAVVVLDSVARLIEEDVIVKLKEA
jgi:isoprenylcysteine carboxyl methyltransferase (ICMT) family protein YpbQ